MTSLLVIAIASCLSLTTLGQVSPQTFDRPIAIKGTSIRMDSLVKAFSRQTGVEFSFSTNRIRPSKNLPVVRQPQTLSQWLTRLQQEMGVQYKVVGNHIILFDAPRPAATTRPSSSGTSPKQAPASKTHRSGQAAPARTAVLPDNSQAPASDTTAVRASSQAIHRIDSTPVAVSAARATTAIPTTSTQPANSAYQPAAKPVKRSASQPVSSPAPSTTSSPADDDEGWKREMIQLIVGYSKHNSGDMNGIVFGADYSWYLGRKFSLSLDVRGTVHSSEMNYLYYYPDNVTKVEGTIRSTTAGAQLGLNGAYSLLRSQHHEIRAGLGAYLRYQSESLDGYSVLNPQVSERPEVLFSLYHWEPQKSISPGLLAQLQYHCTIGDKFTIGFKAGIQTDMEGDGIWYGALSVGKRF